MSKQTNRSSLPPVHRRVMKVVVLCAFILALCHMLLATGNAEIILLGLIFVAGAVGGYGMGRSRCG